MIIVWRGLGLPIMMAGLGVTTLTIVPFDRAYLMSHSWPRLVAFGTGGALVYWLAWWRQNRTGVCDSMYFIPMKAWAVVLLAIGICWSFLPSPNDMVSAREYPNPARTKAATVNGMRLQGIFYNGDQSSTAIINNTTVSVGDKVGDYTVSAIAPQLVTLKSANGQETVLRVSTVNR